MLPNWNNQTAKPEKLNRGNYTRQAAWIFCTSRITWKRNKFTSNQLIVILEFIRKFYRSVLDDEHLHFPWSYPFTQPSLVGGRSPRQNLVIKHRGKPREQISKKQLKDQVHRYSIAGYARDCAISYTGNIPNQLRPQCRNSLHCFIFYRKLM